MEKGTFTSAFSEVDVMFQTSPDPGRLQTGPKFMVPVVMWLQLKSQVAAGPYALTTPLPPITER